MIEDLKNICLKKHIQYLIILLLGMFVAAVIEMIGLGSIPMFIMIIIDIDILINKYPDFFANDYIVSLEQNYITIFGGIILILIFVIKNIPGHQIKFNLTGMDRVWKFSIAISGIVGIWAPVWVDTREYEPIYFNRTHCGDAGYPRSCCG